MERKNKKTNNLIRSNNNNSNSNNNSNYSNTHNSNISNNFNSKNIKINTNEELYHWHLKLSHAGANTIKNLFKVNKGHRNTFLDESRSDFKK